MSDQPPQENQPTNQEESVTIDVASNQNQNQPAQQAGQEQLSTMGKVNRALLERHIQYDPIAIVFTLLVFIGGVAGYVSKGSVVSLVSGTLFAILLAFGTWIEGSRKNPYPLLVILFGLGAMMIYRYVQTFNFIPAGLFALLTLIMFIRHLYLVYLKRQSSP